MPLGTPLRESKKESPDLGTDPSTPNKAPKFHDSSCPIPVTHPSLCHKSRLRREPPIAHMCACAPLLLNPANDTQLPLSVPTISPCTPQPITAAHTQLHCTHTTGGLARIRLWNGMKNTIVTFCISPLPLSPGHAMTHPQIGQHSRVIPYISFMALPRCPRHRLIV